LTEPNYAPYGVYRGFGAKFPTVNPRRLSARPSEAVKLLALTIAASHCGQRATKVGLQPIRRSEEANGMTSSFFDGTSAAFTWVRAASSSTSSCGRLGSCDSREQLLVAEPTRDRVSAIQALLAFAAQDASFEQ
jgi:hypothetical protein